MGGVWWRGAFGCVLALALTGASPVVAQTKTLAELLAYKGKDREALLLAGAKKEGGFYSYTSQPAEDVRALVEAFEKKYGVKANIWRGGSEDVVQKTVAEARAGRNLVDVVSSNGTDMTALVREGLMQQLDSPHFADLIPGALPKHRQWVAMELQPFLQAYNTNLVQKDILPKKWEDLLDPRWKGRITVEYDDADWFSEVVEELGEAKGLKLFADIVAKNGLTARKGHSLLGNLVASGEAPLALTVYLSSVAQLIKADAPVDWFVIEPLVARPAGIGILKNAPHPYAAALYVDFITSDAQEMLLNRGGVPVASYLDSPIKGIPMRLIEPDVSSDRLAKWQDIYRKLVGGRK